MAIRDNLLIRLLITATDRASNTLNGITQSLRGMLTQVLAWGAALLSLNSVVNAAEKLETQMGKLRGTIAATGGAAGLTAEEIDQMARDIDEATLGGAANIRDAAAQLLTFKSVSKEVFERTLRASQDLSSTGFGSVEQAAVQLGKALEDPLTGLGALTRVGVSFDAQQKAQIETAVKLGQTLEAQKVILAAVEGQVKGVASAAGSGLAGAIDLVGKRLTDLKEIVGGQIIGVWGQLNLQFAEFLNQAKQAADASTVIRDTLVLLGLVVTRLGGAFQYAGAGIGTFLAALATRDFSLFSETMERVDLQLRANMANMAALSDTFKDRFQLPADVAARLAELTGQVADKTQQAGAAAGAAAPQMIALADGYQKNARAVELLQAVLDRKLSAQDALNALRREEAKLSGDISTQLTNEIEIAKEDVRLKDQKALAAATESNNANRYLDLLRQQQNIMPDVIKKAEEDAAAKQKQADNAVLAAKAAQLQLKVAQQAPQVQALATQNKLLQTTLDYERRISEIRDRNLSQRERDSQNFARADEEVNKAILLRLSLTDKSTAADKKATQAAIDLHLQQANSYAGQIKDSEKAILAISTVQSEAIRSIKQTADEADVKALIDADDKPARKQMAGFIEWANQQEITIPVRLVSQGGTAGGSLSGIVDGLTRGANAQ